MRDTGTLGTEVAAALAAELGLQVFSSEIAAGNIADRVGVPQSTVQRYVDGSASWFERWQIDKRKLSLHTYEEILLLARQGNVLIRGWGAAALFRNVPQVISVRVCAPMKFRQQVMMKRLAGTHVD